MRFFKFAVSLAMTAILCAPVGGITLGSTPPTIIVRNKPTTPLTAIYVVYSGSLSEMVVAEQTIAKVFENSGVTVMAASSDISNISELQSNEAVTRIAARLAPVGKQVAVLQIKLANVAGSEMKFVMTLKAVEAGEIAAGEVQIDTEGQLSFSGSEAQSLRMAIRDATRRFVNDKKIRPLFVP